MITQVQLAHAFAQYAHTDYIELISEAMTDLDILAKVPLTFCEIMWLCRYLLMAS